MPAPRASSLVLHAFAACVLVASLATPGGAAPAPAPAKKPTPLPTSPSAAAPVELVEELEGGGRINWTSGRMSVSGVGTPGDRGAMSYRRTLASRAARADAYRRLASSLELVRVDANQRVKDLAVIDDALRSRLNDYVKSAKLLETNFWPDGSAELVLGVDLKGERSLTTMIGGAQRTPPAPAADASPAPADAPAASPAPGGTEITGAAASPAASAGTKEIVTEPVNVRSSYSALIVDARGLGAQPALLPLVRDKDAKAIELGHGAVKYLRDGAELDPAAGLNPLRIKAHRTHGTLRADLVIGPEASERLKTALRDNKLRAGHTVLVVL